MSFEINPRKRQPDRDPFFGTTGKKYFNGYFLSREIASRKRMANFPKRDISQSCHRKTFPERKPRNFKLWKRPTRTSVSGQLTRGQRLSEASFLLVGLLESPSLSGQSLLFGPLCVVLDRLKQKSEKQVLKSENIFEIFQDRKFPICYRRSPGSKASKWTRSTL